jgi:hypothetical protein
LTWLLSGVIVEGGGGERPSLSIHRLHWQRGRRQPRSVWGKVVIRAFRPMVAFPVGGEEAIPYR